VAEDGVDRVLLLVGREKEAKFKSGILPELEMKKRRERKKGDEKRMNTSRGVKLYICG